MKNFASLLFKLNIVVVLNILPFVQPVYASEQVSFSYTDECTTDATEWDGTRHSCYSAWSTQPLPTGYAYVKDSLKVSTSSANGSENECKFIWENEVEFYPNTKVYLPTVLKTQAYARSPKGHSSGRGWTKCIYEGYYTQLPPP